MGAINKIKSGSFTGNGTSQDLTTSIGYRPILFIISNRTDGDSITFHTDTMTAASSIAVGAAAATSANSVTFTDYGVTLGSSSNVNESAKVFDWVAIGE